MPETAPDFNHNQLTYSVSEVASAIKRAVEDQFGRVRLRGEISGWKVASSGHVYFRLKDDNAVIDAICWKGTMSKLAFKPEDGLEVVATGKVTTYPGRSSYQIIIDQMEPAGAGALMAVLEKRRKMFEEEGLFDASRKRQLPYLPQTVGVVTSPTGAVIRDILHRISDRFPCHVLVWPVAVQGDGAAQQIAAAIEGFNKMTRLPDYQMTKNHTGSSSHLVIQSSTPRPDVIIVARGGGSIEDLWAFNEEIVVRAAANSRIPLISAVGHETDTTLIDYVSDKRAPTPTAAAELAVPVRDELLLAMSQLGLRNQTAIHRQLSQKAERLEGLLRGLPKPIQLLQMAEQRLDDWTERLIAALPATLERKAQQLALVAGKLRPQTLYQDITRAQTSLIDYQQRMNSSVARNLQWREERLANLSSLLESVNYKKILARGFVLVKDMGGKLITSAKDAKGELSLQFADGEVCVTMRDKR